MYSRKTTQFQARVATLNDWEGTQIERDFEPAVLRLANSFCERGKCFICLVACKSCENRQTPFKGAYLTNYPGCVQLSIYCFGYLFLFGGMPRHRAFLHYRNGAYGTHPQAGPRYHTCEIQSTASTELRLFFLFKRGGWHIEEFSSNLKMYVRFLKSPTYSEACITGHLYIRFYLACYACVSPTAISPFPR